MNKIYPAFILLIILLALLVIVLFNADRIDGELPPRERQVQVVTCTAIAFCQYGVDKNGIDTPAM